MGVTESNRLLLLMGCSLDMIYETHTHTFEQKGWYDRGNCKATPTAIICLHNIGYWIGYWEGMGWVRMTWRRGIWGKEIGISLKFVRPNTHSRKDNNGWKRIIAGGRKIYAGDKFKTHVLVQKEEEKDEHEVAECSNTNLLFIYCLCYCVCFSFVWGPTQFDHTRSPKNTIEFDPVILVTDDYPPPSLWFFSRISARTRSGAGGPEAGQTTSLGDWLVLRALLTWNWQAVNRSWTFHSLWLHRIEKPRTWNRSPTKPHKQHLKQLG